MLILKLQPLTDAFDWLHVAWEHATTQRRVAFCILWVYLLALLGVELRRQGLLPPWLAAVTPLSHFYAIHLAFTLILGLEVMSLILVIPSSLSQSMGKQFEILTLILLRNAFKELANLPGLYRRMARCHPHFIQGPQLRMGYVLSKKLLALTLFCVFLFIGVRDFIFFIRTGADQNFFETLYTVLIFADIALVLIAQRYMPAFHAVFRNSGFVIGTLLMRLALSASPLWSPVIGLFAAVFVLALTWGTNYFTPEAESAR